MSRLRCGPKPRPLSERFWEKVRVGGLDECWPFLGARGPRGQGRIGSGGKHGKTLLASRVAFALTRGPVPDGLFACHHCDHPWCCNPVCLFAGTPLENSQDMVRKGRQAPVEQTFHPGERKWSRTPFRRTGTSDSNGTEAEGLGRHSGGGDPLPSHSTKCSSHRSRRDMETFVKLRRLAFRGLTCFQGEPVRLDFEAMGSGLIAITGENGAGKSTTMESIPACLYKRLPTRPGSLYEKAHGRDAFVECEFVAENADQVKVRVQIDCDRRTTEGYVFVNGAPVTTGRAAEFTAAIEKHFGSEDLFMASMFTDQEKTGSFLRAKPSKRKEVFAELLSLVKYQALAEVARDRRATAEADLTVARKVLETARTEAAQLEQAEKALGDARTARDTLAERVSTSRALEDARTGVLQECRVAAEKREALQKAFDAAEREVQAAERAVREAETLPEKAQEEAQRRRQSISVQNPDDLEAIARRRAKEAQERHGARLKEASDVVQMLEPAIQEARAQTEDLRETEKKLKQRQRDREKLLIDRDTAQARSDAAQRRLEDAEKRAREDIQRLMVQAEAMNDAPCTTAASWDNSDRLRNVQVGVDLAGKCPLLAEARKAKIAITAVRVDGDIKAEVAMTAAAYSTLLDQVHERAEQDETDAAILRSLDFKIPGLEKTIARTGEVEAAKRTIKESEAENKAIEADLSHEMEKVQSLRDRVFDETEKIAADLRNALADAVLRQEAAEERLATARQSKSEAPDPATVKAVTLVDVLTAEAAMKEAKEGVARATSMLSEADKTLGRLESEFDRIRGHVVMATQRDLEVKAAEEQVGDWALLERALGKDGIQALEIDAAGPEVSTLTNELLAACYGPRFSIALETLREKKSAPGEFSEAFDVKVFDGKEERMVEDVSGGEKVIIGEAFGLAVAIYSARKSGVRWKTAWRDETTGALDPANAARYVEMLRRAMSLGGFEQLVFVSHSEAIWERADVKLLVKDARIEVMA